MKRALFALVFALVAIRALACVPWDQLVDECLESGRCELAPDGAIIELDSGEPDAGFDSGVVIIPDSGTPDAGPFDAGATSCPVAIDDPSSLGGCRRGGICGAVFVDGGPVRIFAVEKPSPCGFAEYPVVSVVADRALLAWNDVDAGPGPAGEHRVRWAEINLNAPVVTASDAFSGMAPASFAAVAYRGDGGALAFAAQTQAGRFHDAYVCRLNSGALSPPLPAFETDVDQTDLSLSASDGGYLLLFREVQQDAGTFFEGIRAVRLSLTAQPTSIAPGSTVAMLTRFQQSPQVLFDGLDYRAIWADSRAGNNSGLFDTFTANIDPGSLAVSGTSGLAITNTPAQTDERPSLACASPALCATAYLSGGGLVKVSMINAGTAGSQVQLSSGGVLPNSSTAIGFTGRDFLVVWSENTATSGTNIHYARVGLDGGIVRGETPLLDVGGNQLRPALSCSPQACAVVWEH